MTPRWSGLIGLAIGAILRHTAGAITASVAVLFVLPLVLMALPTSWEQPVEEYWPTQAGSQLEEVTRQAHALTAWWGTGDLALFVVVLSGHRRLRPRQARRLRGLGHKIPGRRGVEFWRAWPSFTRSCAVTLPVLWLVRHGETEWSASGKHTSWTDLPLTPAGEQEAAALGRLLNAQRFDLVKASPRLRARRTAELAGYKPDVDDDLVEWDYGDFEGLTTREIRTSHPGWSLWDGPWPKGETPEQVAERADRVVPEDTRASAWFRGSCFSLTNTFSESSPPAGSASPP